MAGFFTSRASQKYQHDGNGRSLTALVTEKQHTQDPQINYGTLKIPKVLAKNLLLPGIQPNLQIQIRSFKKAQIQSNPNPTFLKIV